MAELYHDDYPYTVEVTYEVKHKGLISWPTWYPQRHRMPVEQARFEIEAPARLPVRYTARGAIQEPIAERDGKRQVLRWTASMLPGRASEPYGPPASEQVARVHTAPVHFEIEDVRGDMSSWQAFGAWYHGLSRGRSELPAEAVQEVKQLLAGVDDPLEKARRLYRHLQETTRYVSIQLGIGGWQPFEAAYVYERGYGDCKALVNYMKALLEAAGLEAFPALIRHGTEAPAVLADFPSNQFNHVVLAVPMEADTLWLECTSQTIPFGHLGAGNEGRHALLVDPEGGRLVRTPSSTLHANQQLRHSRIRLAATGDATAEVHTRYTGNQQDRLRGALAQRSLREQEAWLRRAMSFSSVEIVRADFSAATSGRSSSVALPVTLRLPRYAARTGARLFLPLNQIERWTHVPPPMESSRTQPIEFASYAFLDADTTVFELPEGFRVEAAPGPVVVEAPFARYEAVVEQDAEGGPLVYRRHLEVHQPVLPAEQYEAFRAFLRQVVQADRAQVVLVEHG